MSLGGKTLLSLYNNSVLQLLCAIYPEYNWLPWKFQFSSLEDFEANKLIQLISKELRVTEKKDWYNVSIEVRNCDTVN